MLQVSRSLYQKDKRIFTFILCLDLMIYKQQLETKDVDILMTEVIVLQNSAGSYKLFFMFRLIVVDNSLSSEYYFSESGRKLEIQAKADLVTENPTSWLANDAWAQICSLGQIEAFRVKIVTFTSSG